jgi:hypothetical protein
MVFFWKMPVIVKSGFAKRPTLEEAGLLGIKITGSEPELKNIHIGLLIDTSGSMEGDRIDSVKRTLGVLLNRLSLGDSITLVGFSSSAKVILDSVTITNDNKLILLGEIDKLITDGGTNLEAGISGLGQILKENTVLNALVVLTDGHINEGITSVAGLHSLINSYLKSVPVYTLGYGSDHNADLLKTLSFRTRANYTFVQDEIVLPISMGDLLGALQTEVASGMSIIYNSNWKCIEPLAEAGTEYNIGSLIADKPMWVIFRVPLGQEAADYTIKYKDSTANLLNSRPQDNEISPIEVEEQYVRCVTGTALNKIGDAMRKNKLEEAKALISTSIADISRSLAANRPLVIRMKAQLEETLEEVNKAMSRHRLPRSPPLMTPPNLLNRITSLGGNYSAQRGVTQMANGMTPSLFSSVSQEQQGNEMAAQYSVAAGDPLEP